MNHFQYREEKLHAENVDLEKLAEEAEDVKIYSLPGDAVGSPREGTSSSETSIGHDKHDFS